MLSSPLPASPPESLLCHAFKLPAAILTQARVGKLCKEPCQVRNELQSAFHVSSPVTATPPAPLLLAFHRRNTSASSLPLTRLLGPCYAFQVRATPPGFLVCLRTSWDAFGFPVTPSGSLVRPRTPGAPPERLLRTELGTPRRGCSGPGPSAPRSRVRQSASQAWLDMMPWLRYPFQATFRSQTLPRVLLCPRKGRRGRS